MSLYCHLLGRMASAALCCLLLLAGCAEPLPLEPAEPLGAARAELERLPGYGAGDFEPELAELTLPSLAGGSDKALRIWFARREDALPVVVFSHGNWSDKDRYEPLLKHWASHGFAVIATTHLDGRNMARGIFNALRYGNEGLIAARVADVRELVYRLPEIQSLLPVALDAERLAVAGHSFGAFTAQQFAGARAITADGEIGADDARVAAVVALSPPGPMFDEITEQSWTQMQGPVFMTTGTHDVNPQFWPDWRLHKMSFDTALSGDQYALVVQGADHYLGNLICRPEREAEPQVDAFNLISALSTVFLQAYLHADEAQVDWLQGLDLAQLSAGFAELQRR
ncbi:alpha/beta hydrolase family protein [Spongiibacter sp.]|uniref:alpha/beta hydrolase family protein n=1 Tax=Spongiibacter sp. TaxID=2024860 RepID=UPI0035677AFA